jgi:hypothetical protein
MDSHCLAALLAASQTMKSRGEQGVTVVLFPGSGLARQLKLFAAGGELPACDSAAAAIGALSWRRHSPQATPTAAEVVREHARWTKAVRPVPPKLISQPGLRTRKRGTSAVGQPSLSRHSREDLWDATEERLPFDWQTRPGPARRAKVAFRRSKPELWRVSSRR